MTETKHQRYYRRHKAEVRARVARWMADNPERYAYNTHKGHAKRRGVEFKLSFDQWREWWGKDFALRGRTANALQMCRYGDTGPYEIGNIYKATNWQNRKDSRVVTITRNDETRSLSQAEESTTLLVERDGEPRTANQPATCRRSQYG